MNINALSEKFADAPIESILLDDGREIKAKKIHISCFELTRIELPEVDFRIVCSKGTYIRAIARDFGFALGSGAHLSALRRERIGDFSVSDALQVDAVRTFWKEN